MSPNYVSNGHWAIARSQLDPTWGTDGALATLTRDIRPQDDAFILRAYGERSERAWELTKWLYEHGRDTLRVAVAENGDLAYFNTAYLAVLGLTVGSTLYAKTADVAFHVGDENTGVIMPVRCDGVLPGTDGAQ